MKSLPDRATRTKVLGREQTCFVGEQAGRPACLGHSEGGGEAQRGPWQIDHLVCPRHGGKSKEIHGREFFALKSLNSRILPTVVPHEGSLVAHFFLALICPLDFDRLGIYAKNCPHGLQKCE